MKYRNTIFFGILAFMGCGGVKYKHTSSSIDLPRYMGSWYVWAGRTTFVEKDAHNAIEKYTWNSDKNRVDIDFTFHKGSANGKIKSLPQKA
jgi:apolipoprotein D and lipocalin family protein